MFCLWGCVFAGIGAVLKPPCCVLLLLFTLDFGTHKSCCYVVFVHLCVSCCYVVCVCFCSCCYVACLFQVVSCVLFVSNSSVFDLLVLRCCWKRCSAQVSVSCLLVCSIFLLFVMLLCLLMFVS